MPAVTLRKLLSTTASGGSSTGGTTGGATSPGGGPVSSGLIGHLAAVGNVGGASKNVGGPGRVRMKNDQRLADYIKRVGYDPGFGQNVFPKSYTDYHLDPNTGEWKPIVVYWDMGTPNDDPFRDSTPRSDVRGQGEAPPTVSLVNRQRNIAQFQRNLAVSSGPNARPTARSRSY